MSSRTPEPPGDAPMPPSPPRRSWLTWIALAAALGLLYLWQASGSQASLPEVDYSTAYHWISDGKVKSAVLRGSSLTGELTAPQTVDKRQVSSFHTMTPPEDRSLLPLIHQKNVQLKVESPESSPLVRIFFGLLPWILI